MRILQVCKKFPFPLRDGEAIAINQLTYAFHELGNETFVAALNTRKHHTDTDELPEEFTAQAKYETVEIDTSTKTGLFIKSFFKGTSFNIERFRSAEFEALLAKLCTENKFDIIQLEGLYLTYYIPVIRKHSKAKIIFRPHNIEHLIWQRLARHEMDLTLKILYRYFALRLRKAEKEILDKVDALVPISEPDAIWFKAQHYKGPVMVCPVGMDTPPPVELNSDSSVTRFFHIGSMDWLPNVEGLNWFMENVWKDFVKTHNNVELHLAGRNFPPGAFHNMRNVTVHGEVEDAFTFMSRNDVMIVPLFSGSGTRIKILEAMNLSKTVITTLTGKEGINVTDNENILIADNAVTFIQKMEECISNKAKLQTIGANASAFIRKEFDTLAVGQKLLDFYAQL